MNVDIAERLAARRKKMGFSQEALAEKLGVSRQAVSKWERSESSPDTDNLIALARLYGLSLDELLYVDDSIQDDIEFEAADRAAQRAAAANTSHSSTPTSTPPSQASTPSTQASTPPTSPGSGAFTSGTPASGSSGQDAPSPGSGASASASYSQDASASSGQDAPASPSNDNDATDEKGEESKYAWSNAKKVKEEYVHVGFSGIHVEDGTDSVHLSWKDGIHVKSGRNGEEVNVGWDGVHVKDPQSKKDSPYWVGVAGEDNSFTWDKEGVNINGEHFDDWHDAHEKYNHIHESKMREKKTWIRFPFYLIAIIAYLLIGFATNEWGVALFVFATIPVYYMLVEAIYSKKIAHFIEGLYPIACVVWFLYMAFVLGQPHPAWVVFLTIPVVEWIVVSISLANKKRKKKAGILDVEAEEDSASTSTSKDADANTNKHN